MQIHEIRSRFLKFFQSKGHQEIASAPLIPQNDPSLLFVNAGMVPFKDYFLGQATAKNPRATSSQKCVRAGGKHNDLDQVGMTARHHTFFEMLGNFSFGDYFKKEAISFAWELLTKEYGISKDKLYVTVHHSDQEAADIWHDQEGVPRERIFFRGDKDNFWEMGETGPCGPCSEIFYDHGEAHTDPNADTSECILDDEDRYIEIWNLVFMQYERFREGDEIKQRNLPKPSVDTGAGLERLAAALQGKYNNYDTDAFTPIISKLEELCSHKYQDNPTPFRVVGDHVRSSVMMLTDGVIPSSEGRGYVLRRIIRRAIRFMNDLGIQDTTLPKLVDPLFESFGGHYSDNARNAEFARTYLQTEEEAFRKTLSSGLKLLEKEIQDLKGKTLSGEVVFTLYDTHGFPVDLTELILRERELDFDRAGLEREMNAQRERSRAAGQFGARDQDLSEFYKIKEEHGETGFTGYTSLSGKGKLLKSLPWGEHLALVFDQTPFYGESGGQAGDIGRIEEGGSFIEVLDTQKPVEGIHAHIVSKDVSLKPGESVSFHVDKVARGQSAANHTATHLLHAALQKVLGEHVKQSGSYVGPDRLRFDFTNPKALTNEQLHQVERMVNSEIRRNAGVESAVMTKDQATAKGAMALFGEKYGNEVRVIDIPGFSVELCGGTHVDSTSDIVVFKILSESALAAGVRRIEAVSSTGALDYLDERSEVLSEIERSVKLPYSQCSQRVDSMTAELKKRSKEIQELKDQLQTLKAKDALGDTEEVGGVPFKHLDVDEETDLRKLGQQFVDKYTQGVVLLTSARKGKLSVYLQTGNSGIKVNQILKDVLGEFGGRGGGKPNQAQGACDGEPGAVAAKVREELA